MEEPLLDRNDSGELQLIGDDGDYRPVKGLKAWPFKFFANLEPILLPPCLLAILEIWSILSIATSVISTSFGFMVLGQSDEIANLAGVCTLMIVPQLFLLAVTFPTQKFLQAQSKVSELAWLAFLALVLQGFTRGLFVYVFGWGTSSAAAYDLTSWGTAIAQFVMNVIGWEAMIFIGINAATSIRVSNELGLGHPQPQAAKYSVYITVFQSLLISILCMIIILAARNHFSIIFTSSKCMQRGCFPPFWPSWNDYGSVLKPVISGTLWWHDSRNSFADIAILVSSLQN
ncbi:DETOXIFICATION 35-like [Olea europaea subsp. europaea]|uniref:DETOXIFICATION 35-like n=1 Tax=Olea europaea subsp. europaea TaxID=158383 RepID=A0A8S0V1Z9_OLEEU|nr:DETOXIFICATION 35-like [Olea europaea subsp. europaea]